MTAPATAARTNRNGKRPKSDFYPSPPSAVHALLSVEPIDQPVWEPACGDGAISRVLEARGLPVVSTDMNAHGYGRAGVDFLLEQRLLAPIVVTNPPYSLADAFVRHAMALGAVRVAMLLRLAYLEGIGRSDVLDGGKLARVHVFRDRLTMAPKGVAVDGSSTIAFAWFVWDAAHCGPASLHRITARDFGPARAEHLLAGATVAGTSAAMPVLPFDAKRLNASDGAA